jgi:hypothetical protein
VWCRRRIRLKGSVVGRRGRGGWIFDDVRQVSVSKVVCSYHGVYSFVFVSQKHTASHHRHRIEIGRIQELFPAPCRRGESLPEAFSTPMIAFGVMCE